MTSSRSKWVVLGVTSGTSTRSFFHITEGDAFPSALRGCVVAIGNFDGVHLGHAAVIARARALADRLKTPCCALTFEPHPVDFFAGAPKLFRLTPEPAKALALSWLDLDGVIVVRFDQGLAQLPAADFIQTILIDRLAICGVVVGHDFHFGRAREGTTEILQLSGAANGFAVDVVEKLEFEAQGQALPVSSTATRQALEQGDVAAARALLGHDYFMLGTVVHGQKIGRTLGFPTANIVPDPSCRLRPGVYAVRARFKGAFYDGVASYGRRPSFDNGPALLEVMLFDYCGDLYGETLEVDFCGFIRAEEKFDDIKTLKQRMHRDVDEAKAVLRA